jgi:hypothetical protein
MGGRRPNRETFARMTDDALTAWITTTVEQCRALPLAVATLVERTGISYGQLRSQTGLPKSTAQAWVSRTRSASPGSPTTDTGTSAPSTSPSTTPP